MVSPSKYTFSPDYYITRNGGEAYIYTPKGYKSAYATNKSVPFFALVFEFDVDEKIIDIQSFFNLTLTQSESTASEKRSLRGRGKEMLCEVLHRSLKKGYINKNWKVIAMPDASKYGNLPDLINYYHKTYGMTKTIRDEHLHMVASVKTILSHCSK